MLVWEQSAMINWKWSAAAKVQLSKHSSIELIKTRLISKVVSRTDVLRHQADLHLYKYIAKVPDYTLVVIPNCYHANFHFRCHLFHFSDVISSVVGKIPKHEA